jgi:phage tail sheath protein FI
MPANFLHGVETIELKIGPRPIKGVKTAVIGLVGTAPLYDVAADYQTPNQATLVLSDTQAKEYFGTQRAGFTLPASLAAGFKQGNGPIYIAINVLDPAVHVTSVTNEAQTFDSKGVLSLAHPQVNQVVVKNSAGTTTYVAGTDYTLAQGDGVITRIEGGAITAGASVKISYQYLDPSKVTNSDLIGAVNLAGNRTGLQLFLESYQQFGFYPKILIVPGYSSNQAIATEMVSLATRIRAVAPIDAPAGTTPQQAITGRGPEGSINFNTASERAVLCYPHVKRWDTDLNAEVVAPYSAFYAGVLARNDIENGYWWSPSNQEILGITGVERNITAMINDPTSEANLLNESGITTIFNSFGSGFRVWGNRSAAWPSETDPKNFVNIRRVADVIHESIEYSMLQFIDQPITNAWIDSVTESVNSFIRTLIARGALVDGSCWYDPNNNPATELALGHVTFNYAFMPPPPAERITFESFVDINLLSKLGT